MDGQTIDITPDAVGGGMIRTERIRKVFRPTPGAVDGDGCEYGENDLFCLPCAVDRGFQGNRWPCYPLDDLRDWLDSEGERVGRENGVAHVCAGCGEELAVAWRDAA